MISSVTSKCVKRSFHAVSPEEEFGGQSDQAAAWSTVLVPKQTLQSRVVDLWAGQHLHHLPTLHRTHTHTAELHPLANITASISLQYKDFLLCICSIFVLSNRFLTLSHWRVLWYRSISETPILPKKLCGRLSSSSFWHTVKVRMIKSPSCIIHSTNQWAKTHFENKMRLFFCIKRLWFMAPVSAKAAKGTDSLSLLSDRSAMAMEPLICSSWLGWWLVWQMDLKTFPIVLQSSCLAQSWQAEYKTARVSNN